VYGTHEDPEYVPIAHWSRGKVVRSVLAVAFVPLSLPFRWGLLGPLSHLVPPLRRLVVGKLSTLVINPAYTRPMPRGSQTARWNAQEAGGALFVWAVAAGIGLGWIPWWVLLQWWCVGAGILVVNQVRTLVAHAYENQGGVMDTESELLDSINLRLTPMTLLFAPVGLRYHALHHAVPSLPYHSLGKVHRRLLAELSRDAAYRFTLRDGLWASLRALWVRTGPHATPEPQSLSENPAARGL
jgi:fatty acid desaturase